MIFALICDTSEKVRQLSLRYDTAQAQVISYPYANCLVDSAKTKKKKTGPELESQSSPRSGLSDGICYKGRRLTGRDFEATQRAV